MPGDEAAERLRAAGVRLHEADLYRLDGASIAVLRTALERERPAIVHALTSRALRALRRVRGSLGGARVVYYRGKVSRPRRWHPSDRRRYLSGFVDRFSAVSRAVGSALVEGGVPDNRVKTIYKGHDPTWYDEPTVDIRSELGLGRERFVAAVVANMRSEKGIDETIEAAKLLAAEGVPAAWVLIGRDERGAVARRRKPLSVPGVVYPLGFRADAPRLARSADCFVNASRTEGLPRAVIEAMLCGVPVVATNVGGNAELIHDAVSGLLVPMRSPRAIADAVRKLHDDPDLRRRLAGKAREWAERELTVERTVELTLELYAELGVRP